MLLAVMKSVLDPSESFLHGGTALVLPATFGSNFEQDESLHLPHEAPKLSM